jgi:hypothetical protein
MTEDDARAVVERMRREAWLIAGAALATNLAVLTYQVMAHRFWLTPVTLIALGVIAYGIGRLIESGRRGTS